MNSFKSNPILNTAIIVAIVPVFLYLIGLASHEGFLSRFNLDPVILERSYHSLIISGFSILNGHHWFPAFIALIFVFASITLFVLFRMPFLARRISFFEILIFRKINYSITLMLSICIFFLLYVSVLVLMRDAYSNGAKKANEIKQILNDSVDESRMVNVQINGISKSLYFLTCGSKNCSGIDLCTETIYYFEQAPFSFKLNAADF